jgi:hypothetical protein
MAFCDHDHEAVDVRYLPISTDERYAHSGVYVCKLHYEKEMEYRYQMEWIQTFEHFPAWVTLKKQSDE